MRSRPGFSIQNRLHMQQFLNTYPMLIKLCFLPHQFSNISLLIAARNQTSIRPGHPCKWTPTFQRLSGLFVPIHFLCSPPVTAAHRHNRTPPRHTPSSPPRLPPAFLSIAAAPAPLRRAPPWPHNHCRLVARGHAHPTTVVAFTVGTARWGTARALSRCCAVAHQLPSSSPPWLHGRIPLCINLPACLLNFAESVCCKRIFQMF
jgi:hypothetical protein